MILMFQVLTVPLTATVAVLQEPTMTAAHVKPVHRVLSKWMGLILSSIGCFFPLPHLFFYYYTTYVLIHLDLNSKITVDPSMHHGFPVDVGVLYKLTIIIIVNITGLSVSLKQIKGCLPVRRPSILF